MKKLLFILLLCPALCFAQADTTSKSHEVYCVLTAGPKAFSSKMSISVDYGLDMNSPTVLQNLTAQQRKELGMFAGFGSAVEALNYMAAQGWQLVSSYPVVFDKYTYTFKYVMRRRS